VIFYSLIFEVKLAVFCDVDDDDYGDLNGKRQVLELDQAVHEGFSLDLW